MNRHIEVKFQLNLMPEYLYFIFIKLFSGSMSLIIILIQSNTIIKSNVTTKD